LRNSRTDLMREEGYGAGYRYAHDDQPEGMNDRYLPDEISDRVYYEPKDRGAEAEIRERLDRWRREREAREDTG
nr:replication-associated recombination protein A [Rubrobacter sp.]